MTSLDAHGWAVQAVGGLSIALVLWRADTRRLLLPCLLGMTLAADACRLLPPTTADATPPARARVEGTIEHVLAADARRVRFVVRGTVDRADLPPTAGAAVVTVWRPDDRVHALVPGQDVVVIGTCSGPPHGDLPVDRIARSMAVQFGAWWTLQADARTVDLRAGPAWATHALRATRDAVDTVTCRTFAADVVPIMAALLTGDERRIDASTREAFARTGTAHMFSVSGSHVAVLATVLAMLLSWLPRAWRTVVIIVLLGAFVVLTGARPPAVRAWLAAACVLMGMTRERDVDGLNLLGAAVMVMVVADPVLPWRLSAQLSVGGVVGILCLHRPLRDMLERCAWAHLRAARMVRDAMCVSLAAAAGVAIPSALAFGDVSLVSPLANLIVVPLLSMAMLSGAVAVVLPFGDAYAALAEACVRSATSVAVWTSTWQQPVEHATIVAILVAAGTVWIARSVSARSLRWRMVAWGAALAMGSTFPISAPRTTQCIVRRDVVAIIVTRPAGTILCLLDRRTAAPAAQRDHAVVDLIVRAKPLCVLERGDGASRILDAVEDRMTVRRLPYLGR